MQRLEGLDRRVTDEIPSAAVGMTPLAASRKNLVKGSLIGIAINDRLNRAAAPRS